MSDSTKLTPREFARMQDLRLLQSDSSRYFSAEEWDELKVLQTRAFAEMGEPSDANPRVRSWESLALAPGERADGDMGDMGDMGDAGSGEKFEQGKAPDGWVWPPREIVVHALAEKRDNPVSVISHSLALTYGDAVKINKHNEQEAANLGVDAVVATYMYEVLDARFAVYVIAESRKMFDACLTPHCFIVHPEDVYRLYIEKKVWNAHFPVETLPDGELYYRQVRVFRSNDTPIGTPLLF